MTNSMPSLKQLLVAALCFSVQATRLVCSQPDYVDCDRLLLSGVCSGNDVRECIRMMGVEADHLPEGSTGLFTFPACVGTDTELNFDFGSNIQVFHANGGTIPFDDCSGSNTKTFAEYSGVGTVAWTSPSTPTDVTVLLAKAPGFGTVTTQETTIEVRSSCSTDSPTLSPESSIMSTGVPTQVPTQAPINSGAKSWAQSSLALVYIVGLALLLN